MPSSRVGRIRNLKNRLRSSSTWVMLRVARSRCGELTGVDRSASRPHREPCDNEPLAFARSAGAHNLWEEWADYLGECVVMIPK